MSSREKCTVEVFLRDVAKHEMNIVRDEALHRHLVFKKPNTNDQMFQLVTFPGTLVYTGDMGTYVFSRIPDMFQFFRARAQRPMQINPSYWAEKVDAYDRDGVQEFSPDAFRKLIADSLDDCEASKELRDDVESSVTQHADDGEARAIISLLDYDPPAGEDNPFGELEGSTCKVYTFRFIWCLYALVWGIDRYDDHKAKSATLLGNNGNATATPAVG